MLFKRKIAVQPVVTPVSQPATVIERNTTIEQPGIGSNAAVILVLAAMAILALVWYFVWAQPQSNTTIVTQPEPSQTIVTPAPTTSPNVIVTPPSTTTETTIVNPPRVDPPIITPPAETAPPTGDGLG